MGLGRRGRRRDRGGAGRDYLAGGAGKDVFLYRGLDVGRDLISDFEHGRDRLDLAELPGAPRQAAAWIWLGSERFTGAAWQLRSVATATGTTLLQLDADGDQKTDLEIEFSGQHSFSAADFILGTAAGPATAHPAVPPSRPRSPRSRSSRPCRSCSAPTATTSSRAPAARPCAWSLAPGATASGRARATT
ncbi:M10 family metallopeptidase C-terminal domain-containing protein [Methylobacterium gregans]|uniref:M10 family metallopeptidase C-terminal domain-containing protein n=1 Tax=Methylobacterium gregans TaxID=374424 RepID=UPI00361EEBA5